MPQQWDPLRDLYHLGLGTKPYDIGSALPTLPGMIDGTPEDSSPRPDRPRPELVTMLALWELPDDLLGGSNRMREKTKWLPQEPEEEHIAYERRRERSHLWPIYEDTLDTLVSMPFEMPVHFGDSEPPEDIRSDLKNVDGEGRGLTAFAKDCMRTAVHRGMVHVLINAADSGTTEEQSSNRRVYWNRLDPRMVLDIDDAVDADGERHVTYLRFIDVRTRANRERYEYEKQIRILEIVAPVSTPEAEAGDGAMVEWSYDAEAKRWTPSSQGRYGWGGDGIPFFTMYTKQTGRFASSPPLKELAELNLEHFRSRSDQNHVLRIARLVTLVTLGFADQKAGGKSPFDKSSGKIVLGPQQRIRSPTKDAQVFFLEPGGKGVESGWQDLDRIQDQAERMGARHLTTKTGQVTARAIDTDSKKSGSNLLTWVDRLDDMLTMCLRAHAEWKGVALAEDVAVKIYREFRSVLPQQDQARTFDSLVKQGLLPHREVLIEAKRRGALRSELDPDEAVAEVEKKRKESIDFQMALAANQPQKDDSDPDDDETGAEE